MSSLVFRDEPHHYSVICKLHKGVAVVERDAVICVKGTQHTALVLKLRAMDMMALSLCL